MAARPLQPSEYEIQREVEALRDLRRRSITPGALTIDPDLPNQSPPSSPTAQYWSAKSPNLSTPASDFIDDGVAPPTKSSNQSRVSTIIRPPDAQNNPSDDPLHLFWVPASLHPEIAPAEFRAFLKEHARSPAADNPDSTGMSKSTSLSSSSSLSRKRSMLSRQYRPMENDGVEDENVVPIKRNRSLLYPTNPGPQLTFNDLQKLEELAEEASQSDDPSRLRNVLRRSLSLNMSPSNINIDEMPEIGDEADVPIIVPPPGQILRRTARTKIRKTGLPGDGGGHRFGSSRRGAKAAPIPTEPRSSSDRSSSDHGEGESAVPSLPQPSISDENAQNIQRPDSLSEESSILDAYVRDEDEDRPYSIPIPPSFLLPFALPQTTQESTPLPIIDYPVQVTTELDDQLPKTPSFEKTEPFLHQPQPQRLAVPQLPEQRPPLRTPSPSEPNINDRPGPGLQPSFPSTSPSPPTQSRKEKDKKGLFGKWGGDKGKKGGKDKEREIRDRPATEKEKESSFFGSLFGKKKQDSEYQSSITGGSGRETAQALLGTSKSSKSYVPPTSPGLAPGIGGNPYARYPIHVERAIYRLSHIKLANPRRPLYEQVLISNLMFWYLGVINKAQNPASPNQLPNGAPTVGNENKNDKEREEKEKEEREKEQKEKEEREKVERERMDKEQRERELEIKKKESGRRGSLTKNPPGGPASGRRAEMPIKGPQYEMQHRVMEQEYGGYNGPPPRSPTSPVNGVLSQPYPHPRVQPGPYSNLPTKVLQPQPNVSEHYYQPQMDSFNSRPGLPPGAMPPLDQSSWMSQSDAPPLAQSKRRNPSPNPLSDSNSHRRSHSPPPLNHHTPGPQNQPRMHRLNTSSQESFGDKSGGHKTPTRSLSATATFPISPISVNGGLHKGNSASASVSLEKRPRTSEGRPQAGRSGEEEDLPLAVWQQQRRR